MFLVRVCVLRVVVRVLSSRDGMERQSVLDNVALQGSAGNYLPETGSIGSLLTAVFSLAVPLKR